MKQKKILKRRRNKIQLLRWKTQTKRWITLPKISWAVQKLHLTAKVNNLSEKESSSDAYLGLLILADGNLYRGQVSTPENMASGEEKEVNLEAVLPGDVAEEAIQVLVSFDGTWYQCK
ncbi:MAG: hypothetical protein ACLR6B_06790 [Blautia sp.]